MCEKAAEQYAAVTRWRKASDWPYLCVERATVAASRMGMRTACARVEGGAELCAKHGGGDFTRSVQAASRGPPYGLVISVEAMARRGLR